MAYFDKRHAMPITERAIKGLPELYRLYWGHALAIVPSHEKRPLWLLENVPLVPYICSELFFNENPDDHYGSPVVLALCNDCWAVPALQRLMYLKARYQAIAWNRPIIYVSYAYGALLYPDGSEYPLPCFGR